MHLCGLDMLSFEGPCVMEECFCPTSLARDRAQGRGKRWGDRHRFSANDHIGLDIILTPYSFTFPLRRGCLVKAGIIAHLKPKECYGLDMADRSGKRHNAGNEPFPSIDVTIWPKYEPTRTSS